jgi:hypothetical protein
MDKHAVCEVKWLKFWKAAVGTAIQKAEPNQVKKQPPFGLVFVPGANPRLKPVECF